MNLTPHFSLEEMTASETAVRQGIDNTPPEFAFLNLNRLCRELEKVRSLLGEQVITITSGYRCPELNKAIGGSSASHHMIGLAADFICPSFGNPLEICHKIAGSEIEYDQLIHEFGIWIHIGFDDNPRHQNLTARRGPDGHTVYDHGHYWIPT
jgi:hypothetical protein